MKAGWRLTAIFPGFWLAAVALAAAVVCGCSSEQEQVVRTIANADRVVLVRRPNGGIPRTILIQGDEVQRIAKAISEAIPIKEELSPHYNSTEVTFLNGTNRLAQFSFGHGCFWINGKGYATLTDPVGEMRGSGPIHFHLSKDFRGFIYLIQNVRFRAAAGLVDGQYDVNVPPDGVVSVSGPGILYSWPEKAVFLNGEEVPIQSDFQAATAGSGEKAMLRTVGAFVVNGSTIDIFHLGILGEFEADSLGYERQPFPPWIAQRPIHWVEPLLWPCLPGNPGSRSLRALPACLAVDCPALCPSQGGSAPANRGRLAGGG